MTTNSAEARVVIAWETCTTRAGSTPRADLRPNPAFGPWEPFAAVCDGSVLVVWRRPRFAP